MFRDSLGREGHDVQQVGRDVEVWEAVELGTGAKGCQRPEIF